MDEIGMTVECTVAVIRMRVVRQSALNNWRLIKCTVAVIRMRDVRQSALNNTSLQKGRLRPLGTDRLPGVRCDDEELSLCNGAAAHKRQTWKAHCAVLALARVLPRAAA